MSASQPPLRLALAWNASTAEGVTLVVEAERAGVDSVWVAEAWGSDAFTPLAYLAAKTTTIRLATGIAQIGARTPAMLAMTAMSMQNLSDGRFLLGLGSSGPQIMEGWHGVRFRSPLRAMRETIEIVRMAARGERLSYAGGVYQVPLPEGQGKPIRSMLAPVDVPIFIAALGPRNLALTGEIADGWIGTAFMPEQAGAFFEHLEAGASQAGRSLHDLDLMVPAAVEFTDDPDAAARRHADGYAFTIGAMGSRDQNFYNAAFERQGFGDDVRAVQELWLSGKREAAAARVPIEIGRNTNLLGTPAMVKDRLRLYRRVGITTIQAKIGGTLREQIDTIAQLSDLVREVNAE